MSTIDLFENESAPTREKIGEEAVVLRGFAKEVANDLVAKIKEIETVSPFRHMTTPGGFTMSVAVTNCGQLGWTSDRRGYRYSPIDPITNNPWPQMPEEFFLLARSAAHEAGFPDFNPTACLINRYTPGSKLSLHQDKDEPDFNASIVSVSLGIPATFQFGGLDRSDKKINVSLVHGDVLVWGGVDRMRFHGVLPIKNNVHSKLGEQRINITFRRAT